jgi:hypothetical protein
MMRIKLGFLHTVRDHVTTPLTLSGNEDVLVLSKQPGFRRWATDEMVLADGSLRNALDRETLHQWIDAWFDGVDQFEVPVRVTAE